MKAYIIGGNTDYINFLPDIEVTDKLKDAKIVIFGDGPAVSPSLYKDKKLANLSEVKHDINRDRADKAIYTKLKKDQIAVGIGRGSGFLAVMNGAKLIQYSRKKNPEYSYDITLDSGSKKYVFPAISNNLQPICLIDCDEKDYRILGISKSTAEYFHDDVKVLNMMRYNGDPEIIVFDKDNSPKSICIQFRPDLMPTSRLSKTIKGLIYEYANQ